MRFNYFTDEAVNGKGWFIDEVAVDGFADGFESGAPDWDLGGPALAADGDSLIVENSFKKASACNKRFVTCDRMDMDVYLTGPTVEGIETLAEFIFDRRRKAAPSC